MCEWVGSQLLILGMVMALLIGTMGFMTFPYFVETMGVGSNHPVAHCDVFQARLAVVAVHLDMIDDAAPRMWGWLDDWMTRPLC